jgi:hypothetical protein
MSQSLSTLRWDMTWNPYLMWICVTIECILAIIYICAGAAHPRTEIPALGIPGGPEGERRGRRAGDNDQRVRLRALDREDEPYVRDEATHSQTGKSVEMASRS